MQKEKDEKRGEWLRKGDETEEESNENNVRENK